MNSIVKKQILFVFILIAICNVAYSSTLYWYLAASISKPGIEVTKKFNQSQSDYKVVVVPGGSGNLFGKILAAQTGDLYTPAAESYLEKATKAKIVLASDILLYQLPVFGLSKTGSTLIKSFNDLLKPDIRIALGNIKTMALGKTYLKIKVKLSPSVDKKIQRNTIVKAINVNQIVNYVKLDVVDAGLMFETVANAHHLEYIKIPKSSNVVEVAHIITLKYTKYPKQIKMFKKYLIMNKHIFSKYGYHLELGL